ncbi:MAG TPA: gamma-glutamyl-gamma-aminobutyrate hydrolase family protein [bacterium]|nr:gamma-glutamyl-gamma-aminobutyrate hydrolase family protein [bacterium]
MQPLIGITSFSDQKPRAQYISLNSTCPYSVSAAGGLPLVLPGAPSEGQPGLESAATAYVARLDGLLLSGGGDISPWLYGEQPARTVTRMDLARDQWELALYAAAARQSIPILGVCRGCQVINVANGGTLYQDLPSQVRDSGGHSFDVPMDEPSHHIDIMPGSRLSRMLPSRRVLANSFHHQAIKDVAAGFGVSARALDGVVEGIEINDADSFIVGIQFHPEGMTRRFPEFLGPFIALVNAASR